MVAPPGTPQCEATILLSRASGADQARFIGDQAGGRILLFVATNDFERDFRAFTVAGVRFVRPPAQHSYGTVAVFEDLYGNRWDLIEYHALAEPRPVERTPATRSPQEWVEWMTERQKIFARDADDLSRTSQVDVRKRAGVTRGVSTEVPT